MHAYIISKGKHLAQSEVITYPIRSCDKKKKYSTVNINKDTATRDLTLAP